MAPECETPGKVLTKSTLASAGLTAAGASLLATEYLTDIRAELGDGSERPLRENSGAWENSSVRDLLVELELDHLLYIFEREHISMDVLMDMSHEDLNGIGITAFGHRHRILRKVKELAHSGGAEPAMPVGVATASHVGTQLIELAHNDKDYIAVSEEVGGVVE